MKNLITLFIFCFLFAGNISAQKTALKFSSVYTDLNKGCKTIKGGEGQDDASDCRGIGGYRIYNWFSAATQMFAVTLPKSDETISLATVNLDFDPSKTKVEWRLANGKPFAVIMRVDKYDGKGDGSFNFLGKKIGKELIVKGLKGFEKIDFTVDSKTPNANAKAREMADTSYEQK